jgi:hypothetical protein
MDEHEERAFRYRQRAEELRTITPNMKDETYREILTRIAADYDRLADTHERLAQEDRERRAV